MISHKGKPGIGLQAALSGKKLSPAKAAPTSKKDDLMDEMKLALSRRLKKENKPPKHAEESAPLEKEPYSPRVSLSPLRTFEFRPKPAPEPEPQQDFRTLLKRRHVQEVAPIDDQQFHPVQEQPRLRKISHRERISEPEQADFRAQLSKHRHHHHHHKHHAVPVEEQVRVVQEPPKRTGLLSRLKQIDRAPKETYKSAPTIRQVEKPPSAVRPPEPKQMDRRQQAFHMKRKRGLSHKTDNPTKTRPSVEETDSGSESEVEVVQETKPAVAWPRKFAPRTSERRESENELMKILSARRRKYS